MLVLGRREGERIVCELPDGSRIWVRIDRIKAGSVRVGIEAPPAVRILREELIPAEARCPAGSFVSPSGDAQ